MYIAHDVLALIDEALRALARAAHLDVSKCQAILREMNRGRPKWNKCRLGVRSRRVTGGTLVIEWLRFTHHGRPGTNRNGTHVETLCKGRGTAYGPGLLKRVCQGWEYDVVQAFEDRFRILRDMDGELHKLRRQAQVLLRREEDHVHDHNELRDALLPLNFWRDFLQPQDQDKESDHDT